MSPNVLYAVDGAVARITLNRPEKRNALNAALVAELAAALSAAEHELAVNAILLSGAGTDFCSGADLTR